MFGKRRRKRMKSLAETCNNRGRSSSGSAEHETGSDLPTEIMELILSRLCLKDNVRASLVCKRWLSVAVSVRKANKAPWLMYFPKSGDLFEFYDPSLRKTYCLKLPDLQNAKICYAKNGWLLCFKPRTQRVFFFCPYTQEVVKLPKLQLAFQGVAFSAPPNSPSCILFSVTHVMPNFVAVSTCRPGDTGWITVNYESETSYLCSIWNKVVCCKGLFYCLSLTGWMGVYDPDQSTWAVLPIHPPKCLEVLPVDNWWKQKFMSEHNGEIFVVYACPTVDTNVYKLDERNKRWEKMEDLGDVAFFADFLTSHIRADLLGNMRNNIYFPKVLFYGKRCVTYSMREQRYFPRREGFDWGELDLFDNIWIDAPDDISAVL